MNETLYNWIRERATKLEACQPVVPLSSQEQSALDRIVLNAQVIAIGEMTHGSKEIFEVRERVLRFLIERRKVIVVVIEACFAATRRLNEYLLFGEGTTAEALAGMQFWSIVNGETLRLMSWIREHNASPSGRQRPVRVYGCDLQSIDGPKSELSHLVNEFGRAGQLASRVCEDVIADLSRLPTDSVLYASIKPLLDEADSAQPDESKIAQIQARRLELMAGIRALAEPLVCRLRELQKSLPVGLSDEQRFLWQRCTRSIEQVIEFYQPDGFPLRDRFMAENVAAINAHIANGRLALCAHNLHVSRTPLLIRGESFVSMGCHLSNQLANDYRVIGSAFHHGCYVAGVGDKESEISVALAPRTNAFESFLHEFAIAERIPDFLLDLGPSGSQEEHPWPSDMVMRTGETGLQGDYDQAFLGQTPTTQYDGLIFLTETTPITVLPEYFIRASLDLVEQTR